MLKSSGKIVALLLQLLGKVVTLFDDTLCESGISLLKAIAKIFALLIEGSVEVCYLLLSFRLVLVSLGIKML